MMADEPSPLPEAQTPICSRTAHGDLREDINQSRSGRRTRPWPFNAAARSLDPPTHPMGGTKQMSDAIGEGQSKCPADDDSQHSATDVAAADAGAEGAYQTQGNEDGDESDRY